MISIQILCDAGNTALVRMHCFGACTHVASARDAASISPPLGWWRALAGAGPWQGAATPPRAPFVPDDPPAYVLTAPMAALCMEVQFRMVNV